MNFITKQSIRNKLTLVVAGPLLALIFFIGQSILSSQQDVSKAKLYQYMGECGQAVQALTKNLQIERGYSVGFISSGGVGFGKELVAHRAKTDESITELKKWQSDVYFQNPDHAEMQRLLREVLQDLDQNLGTLRTNISSTNITFFESAGYFGERIGALLSLRQYLYLDTDNQQLLQQARTALSLLQVVEFMGRERAMLADVFGRQGQFIKGMKAQVSYSLALQQFWRKRFLQYSSPSVRDAYSTVQNIEGTKQAYSMRSGITLLDKRQFITRQISEVCGYGGMIHNFKNLVLRKTPKYADRFNGQYDKFLALVKEYEDLGHLTAKDVASIRDLKLAMGKYKQGVSDVNASAFTDTKTLDKIVKVNDGPAVAAITLMARGGDLNVDPKEWFVKQSQNMVDHAQLFSIISKEGDVLLAGVIQKAKRTMFMTVALAIGILVVTSGLALIIINSITKPINLVVQSLNDSTRQIENISSTVSGSSQSLADKANEQAASLEEVSSSLEEITSMVRTNADSSTKANLMTTTAASVAGEGLVAMSSMENAIGEIKNSADATAKIIKTIEEIAFQTNLLALNAAVEAARAGEAGAGFAVVAEEVRNLAQRSAAAAKDSANLIIQSQSNADNGVKASEDVNSIIKQLAETMENVSVINDEITVASKEQASGVEQINTAINQLDQLTQTNAQNANQSANASKHLQDDAANLNNVVHTLVAIVDGDAVGVSRPFSMQGHGDILELDR